MLNTAQTCLRNKESFNLYYREADRNDSTLNLEDTSYNFLDQLTADYVYRSPSNLLLNYERRTVSLKGNATGIYIAFQDTGACISLITVQVYYKLCPSFTEKYAHFARTPTAGLNLVKVTGQCVNHASGVTLPEYVCQIDESWIFLKGECTCELGYVEKNGSTCIGKLF